MDKMEQITILACGYKVTGDSEIISEIENTISVDKLPINWDNFDSGDYYWNDNGKRYFVLVYHDKKIVKLKEIHML